jgi:splicing factor 3B subunit 3
MFASLPADKQKSVAEQLERTPGEVAKKLEDVRNRLM